MSAIHLGVCVSEIGVCEMSLMHIPNSLGKYRSDTVPDGGKVPSGFRMPTGLRPIND
jgi:hypothetical protein